MAFESRLSFGKHNNFAFRGALCIINVSTRGHNSGHEFTKIPSDNVLEKSRLLRVNGGKFGGA
jgi:hypothetical protein